ncbi:hypothetical protein EYZ65_19950, partial [Salmonella enterica subsp. enterica serovar Enteritidis]
TALQAGSIQVKMHPLSIKRAVANMVVNAARYGNGWIKVSSGTGRAPGGGAGGSGVLGTVATGRGRTRAAPPVGEGWWEYD